ncbi:MAG TPA: AsmA family protein [Casimicrobiaceae bacterium]|nr:AsmA family protein [Casimicrobiaceae bacterium]
MRLFWRMLAGFGGLLFLVIVAAGITLRKFDANELIGPIQQHVRDATGRELTIRGGAELKLSLEPKLVIDDVALGNAAWGASPQMLTAKRIEAQVALLPLLRRRVDVVRFALIEPTISLETDGKGNGNWQIGGASGEGGGAARSPGGLAFGDLAISNGTMTYRDGATGKVTNIAIETLSLHARDPKSPISAQFRGKVDDIAISVEGDLGPLDALLQRRWPYPVTLQGEVNGQKASVQTKMSINGGRMGLEAMTVHTGASTITGDAAIVQQPPRNKLTFRFAAPTFALSDLPPAGAPSRAATAAKAAVVAYGAGDEPVPIALLRGIDAEGEISIGELALANGNRLSDLVLQIKLQDGRLDISALQASVFGGAIISNLSLDAAHQAVPALELHAQIKGMDLGALLAAAGARREVRGGKTDVRIDIGATGNTPRQWESTMTGTVIALVGPATLVNTKIDLSSPLNKLGATVNPFHNVDPSTELQCAVIRLPLRDGVAEVERSIAVETRKFGATASGKLDFRTRTLDLAIRPQLRQGVPLDIPQVAELVRFRGPFASPAVAIDSVATATTIARIGAAAYTGGLSLVGESLLSRAEGNPCEIALGRTSGTAQMAGGGAGAMVEDLGNAMGRAFHR